MSKSAMGLSLYKTPISVLSDSKANTGSLLTLLHAHSESSASTAIARLINNTDIRRSITIFTFIINVVNTFTLFTE